MSHSSSTPYPVRQPSRPRVLYTLGVCATMLVLAGSAHGQAPNKSASPLSQVSAVANVGTAARVVPAGHFVTVPFGHAEPVLTCTVLRVCIIELEDRELVVNEPIAGDQERWIISAARSGPDGRNTLIVVKPKQCDITTNIVIPTDRRIYDLALDSPPCSGRGTNPRQAFVRHVRFSYPDDSGARRTAEGTRPGTAADANGDGAAGQAPSPPTAGADSAVAPTLNRNYRVRRERHGLFGLFRRKRIDFPWRPVAIYDDGVRVSLVLPAEARHAAAPVLYALEDDGSRTLVNYAVRDSAEAVVYVADRTFRRGVLVVPNGSREQRLEFENRAWGKPAGRDD